MYLAVICFFIILLGPSDFSAARSNFENGLNSSIQSEDAVRSTTSAEKEADESNSDGEGGELQEGDKWLTLAQRDIDESAVGDEDRADSTSCESACGPADQDVASASSDTWGEEEGRRRSKSHSHRLQSSHPHCAQTGIRRLQSFIWRLTKTVGHFFSAAMNRIALFARQGAGRSGRNMCYRGVKKILAAASPGLQRKLTGRAAIDAMVDLPRAGFKNMFPLGCDAAGSIRVYQGPASGMSMSKAKAFMWRSHRTRLLAGDVYGHIEISGGNGRYYHFNAEGSARPINEVLGPWRRKLVGCFIK